jgi:hypothetical protein
MFFNIRFCLIGLRPLAQNCIVRNMDPTVFDADRAASFQFF